MFCAKCGNEVSEEVKFCSNCGHQKALVEENTQSEQYNGQAPYSGQTSYSDQTNYGGQGSGQKSYNQGAAYHVGTEQKSKVIAGILQIFLGAFGVGRFYLGYTGIGIAQLLVTWGTCGIGGIWPFIDGILILSGQVPTDANGVPLKE